jgi:RNA polymerase-binding transcription factor DksA
MLTPVPLNTVRARLDERAGHLRDEIALMQARSDEADTHEVIDRKEEANEHAREAVDTAGIERNLAELRGIELARQRMADGSYGLCADCGEEIEPARLVAQLTALRCMECQREAERRVAKGLRPL